MSRLSLTAIWCVSLVSLLCYHRVEHNPYGRYFVELMETIHREALQKVDRQPLFKAAASSMKSLPERAQTHRQALFEAAARGMTSLLDEHSMFVTRAEKEDYERDLRQNFSGIGVNVQEEGSGGTKRFVVVSPIVGKPRPAYDAGLRHGDQIVAIDGKMVAGLSLSDVSQLIQGDAGQPVRVTVLHEGGAKPVELVVVRQEIQVDAITGDRRGPDGSWRFLLPTHPPIAYVRIYDAFGDGTVDQLRDALEQLRQQNQLRALVVDIRDNGGGYLNVADQVCELFIQRGDLIVTTRSRPDDLTGQQEIDVQRATMTGPYRGFPMAVLINGDSASASEIFAACMQDHHRAAIVGSRSYGKGVVEKIFPMEMGRSLLKLTTASYWRASGKNIQRFAGAKETDEWGVRPDPGLEVKLDPKQELDRQRKRQERDAFRPDAAREPAEPLDPQLARAVEYLQSQLAAKAR